MSNKIPESLPTIAQWGGRVHKIARYPTEDTQVWSAFNPSIGYSEKNGFIVLIRSSNYYYDGNGHIHVTAENLIRNSLFLGRLDDELQLNGPLQKVSFVDGPMQSRGCEDAKLFRRNGEWYFHAVMKEDSHTPYPRITTFKFDIESLEAKFIKKYESFEYDKVEKNWMTPMNEDNPNFEFVYGPTSIYKNGLVISNATNPPKEAVSLRGGTNLLEVEGGYLAVGHRLYVKKNVAYNQKTFAYSPAHLRKYAHRFLKFDYNGTLTHLSEEFIFEDFVIEFAAGIVEKDEKYVVSYGRQDLSSKICVIDRDSVHKRLIEIVGD